MSDVSKMEGTPWHVTVLKSKRPGKRHDRRGCKYYKEDNHCSIKGLCYSGRYCTSYKKKNKDDDKRPLRRTTDDYGNPIPVLIDDKVYVQKDDDLVLLRTVKKKKNNNNYKWKKKSKNKSKKNNNKKIIIHSTLLEDYKKMNNDKSLNKNSNKKKKKPSIKVKEGEKVYHEVFGEGKVKSFNKTHECITIDFSGTKKKFQFPKAFSEKKLQKRQ